MAQRTFSFPNANRCVKTTAIDRTTNERYQVTAYVPAHIWYMGQLQRIMREAGGDWLVLSPLEYG
ncbi:hypothetical protein IQ266_19005 [filamentous cyanobacterium LEGE 11480]|uniref:Uncharacterized protein n=1 Tax=Romeriopsis navalis LEGE 11480 TaxID=2777977 RepID=A0A928VNG9_9CYAN|nr:hypothetical protein [Romeriopsis navalis]MBE9031828.1 hypothetical protein [Romeriopsis navalis LEGE 11480]